MAKYIVEVRSKKKTLHDDTKTLIEAHIEEGTFVTTKAVTDGLLQLKQNGVLLITGHAGTGKSRLGLHILHMFCTDETSYIMLDKWKEWDDMVNREENVAVLMDDMFGETNCSYNKKYIPILDKIHSYVCKGNIKVIITIRDTVKCICQEVFDSHRLFQFDFIDLSSKSYLLSHVDKENKLTIYMKTVRKANYTFGKGFSDYKGYTILSNDEVSKIIGENTVDGFPLAVYQFVYNDNYFSLGSKYFDRPTEFMLERITKIRQEGENDKKAMMQYAVMVYTAINDNCIDPENNSCVTEVKQLLIGIYGRTKKIKKWNIRDAVTSLEGSFLVNIQNNTSYRFHHQTLQESVIISFAQVDDENISKIIPLISVSFFLKMVKSQSYNKKNGEVVLRITTINYKTLADRLVDFYMSQLRTYGFHPFINSLCKTEIFQQDYCLLLPLLLEAFEKEDDKAKHTENMIKSSELDNLNIPVLNIKNKDIFLADLLNTLAKLEGQLNLFNFVLKTFKIITKTRTHPFTIAFMKAALIESLYSICLTKDIRSVKATLDIVEENTIPVLLDQGVHLTRNIRNFFSIFHWHDEQLCVYLALCIWNAYAASKIHVLEFLLSKYNRTLFDINLFIKMIYSGHIYRNMVLRLGELASLPLKWMIKRFQDQKLDDPNFILRIACKYQMIDTVEYLASGCKTLDVISCLLAFVEQADERLPIKIHLNEELFNFFLKKIEITSTDLIPVVISAIKEQRVPDFFFDAFLKVCLNNTNILTLASENGQFYLVKLMIENSQIEHLDIQSALMAACKESHTVSLYLFHHYEEKIEIEKLNIIKYIVEQIGFKQFDLKAVCRTACSSKYFNIIDWFLHDIDTHRLDVFTIINSALVNQRSDILEHIMNKIEIESLDKREVLTSITKHYTTELSTFLLHIVGTIWDSTDDKQVLQLEEIVNTAYERKCFELLMWIHDNCHPHISIDSKKVFMLACEDYRVDVAKWIFQTFEQTSLDIDGGKLFIKLCSKKFDPRVSVRNGNFIEIEHELIGWVNWLLENFQIKPFDIVSGVLKLLSCNTRIGNDLYNSVVSILEIMDCPKTDDMKQLINKFLEQKQYFLVNWFLEKNVSCSFDKQTILNKACRDSETKTIKILSQYLCVLDMNQAMINACNSASSRSDELGFEHRGFNNDQSVACLCLLWDEINKMDNYSIDIRSIVRTVCQEEEISNNVMTWILLNLPLDQIPINEVLITCCQQDKINHVKYIFHEVDNKQLDIKEAFIHACLSHSVHESMLTMLNGRMIVDYLFQKLHDKTFIISLVLIELLKQKRFDLIQYFLKQGYSRNITMKITMNDLMNEAYEHGCVSLVQWILENDNHDELDIKSDFLEANNALRCKDMRLKPNYVSQLQCLALMRHYKQDIDK